MEIVNNCPLPGLCHQSYTPSPPPYEIGSKKSFRIIAKLIENLNQYIEWSPLRMALIAAAFV
jgi:hypothetical protein